MWYYKGELVEEHPESATDFVYRITEIETNRFYIGKKTLVYKVTRAPLKGYKRKRISWVESDWRTYTGSSDVLNEDIQTKGIEKYHKEILYWCSSRKTSTYLELREQIINQVLEHPDKTFNGTILGKYYHKDISGIVTL